MKKPAVLVSACIFAVIVAVIVYAPRGDGVSPPSRDQVVTDLGEFEMLEVDQQMLERMRVSVSPHMGTMIDQNPMWVDPDMIRLQEENQAQLDRMMGRRPGQP